MPTPFESAQLNLQLYDLRREEVLRQARSWFLSEFNPETFDEFIETVRGERNAWFRMVIGYWDRRLRSWSMMRFMETPSVMLTVKFLLHSVKSSRSWPSYDPQLKNL